MKNETLLAVSLCWIVHVQRLRRRDHKIHAAALCARNYVTAPPAGDVQAAYGTSGNGFPLTLPEAGRHMNEPGWLPMDLHFRPD